MKVHLLIEQQINELNSLNTYNTTFICCDHGLGSCVGETDFDDPAFVNHKELLDSWKLPLEEISTDGT